MTDLDIRLAQIRDHGWRASHLLHTPAATMRGVAMVLEGNADVR